MAYRSYIADAMKITTENTSRIAGGKSLQVRFYDMINKRYEKADTRTGEEIAADVISRAGLKME